MERGRLERTPYKELELEIVFDSQLKTKREKETELCLLKGLRGKDIP